LKRATIIEKIRDQGEVVLRMERSLTMRPHFLTEWIASGDSRAQEFAAHPNISIESLVAYELGPLSSKHIEQLPPPDLRATEFKRWFGRVSHGGLLRAPDPYPEDGDVSKD
jgi:hypothetical protein